MTRDEIIAKLSAKKLRVTPQRVAIMEAIVEVGNHPSAEHIIEYVKQKHAHISIATVYKVLDFFVENKLLRKVKTDGGTMRFDPLLEKHHHLHCEASDRIEDYEDQELDQLLIDYFRKKGISNFDIENVQLHISGTFKS